MVWFRRDLRDFDHAALNAALLAHRAVHCVFVFDTEILDTLGSKADRRVTFIWESVRELKVALESRGGGLHVLHGRARQEIPRLASILGVGAVYANRDYEPLALARDGEVAEQLREAGIDFRTRKDQVIFEAGEVLTQAGGTFSVFTPYRRAWLAKLKPQHVAPLDTRRQAVHLAPSASQAVPTLHAMGFQRADLPLPPGMSGGARLWRAFQQRLKDYAAERDFPALEAPSRLSAPLRFGTISIRELVRQARA